MGVEHLEKLAEFFKVFGDRTRLSILKLLLENEMNVTEISEKLNMNNSAISHQLRVLRTANLVKTRKEGKEESAFCLFCERRLRSRLGIYTVCRCGLHGERPECRRMGGS